MSGQASYLAAIVAVALITYAMRALPCMLLAGRPLPALVVQWMGFVPVAVLSAMVAPSLFLAPEGASVALADNAALWAALPTVALAMTTRNFLVTVVASVVAMALVRHLGVG